MGGCLSVEGRPNELEDLDKFNEDSVVYKGISQERTVTDKWAMVLLGIFIVLNAGFVIYTCTQSDIYRTLNGYDNCGNVCGRKNPVDSKIACSGKDMTNKKFLLETGNNITDLNRQCLENCSEVPGYVPSFERCVPSPINKSDEDIANNFTAKSFFQMVTHDLYMCMGEIFGLCILALVYSVIVVVLLRYATKFMVWFVLILACIIFVGLTTYLWIRWSNIDVTSQNEDSAVTQQQTKLNALGIAIMFTVLTAGILLVVIVMRNRIQLVIQLIKEAGKAIMRMPVLLFEPFLTFIAISIGGILWIYFMILLAEAGTLTQVRTDLYEYVSNLGISFSYILSFFMAIWMYYFIVDCQHMIIAGAVAKWFFTRDKSNLDSPIINSGYNLVRYHLGTVAFGSLLVTIIVIIREAIKQSLNYAKNNKSPWLQALKICIDGCLSFIENLLKLFSKNAYILTAIYGYSFCRAGKRAFTLITNNIFKIMAINSVGDFVLFLMKSFIFVATVVVAFEVFNRKEGLNFVIFPLIIVGVFAFGIAHCFLTVYEMSIDTIFICFCEDYEQNDGIEKPYFMSKDLMNFVETSSKFLEKKPNEANPENNAQHV